MAGGPTVLMYVNCIVSLLSMLTSLLLLVILWRNRYDNTPASGSVMHLLPLSHMLSQSFAPLLRCANACVGCCSAPPLMCMQIVYAEAITFLTATTGWSMRFRHGVVTGQRVHVWTIRCDGGTEKPDVLHSRGHFR